MNRDFRPIGRFPGELLVLGLAICVAVQAFLGPLVAVLVAVVIGLMQIVMLRQQRRSLSEADARSRHLEVEARKWQERANTFMNELSCFRDQIDYQDPETGVGSTRQFEVEFIKQVARYRRRGETFSVVILQARDPRRPDDLLEPDIIVSAAHRLAQTARVEDTLCRVARRGFAVMLAGSDARGAHVYIDRARKRFEEGPIVVNGKRVLLTIAGGAAEFNPTEMRDVQDILSAAARDLHAASPEVPLDAEVAVAADAMEPLVDVAPAEVDDLTPIVKKVRARAKHLKVVHAEPGEPAVDEAISASA